MILVRDMISRLNQHQESIVDLVIGNNHKNIEKLAVTTTITTATTLLLYYMIKKITSKDIDPTPVIPYRWPILGSSIEYFKDKKKFAKEKTEQYGPVFRVHLFGQMVTVVDGNTAHEVFMNPNLDFIKSTHKYFDVPKLLTGLRYDMPENMFRDFIIKEMAQKLPKHSNHFDEECTNVAAEVLGNLKDPKVITEINEITRVFVARTTAYTLAGTTFTQNKEIMDLFEQTADECARQILVPGPARALLPWWNTLYKKIFFPRNTYANQCKRRVRNELRDIVRERLDMIHNKKEDTPDDVLQSILNEYLKDKDEDVILDSLTVWFLSMTFTSVLTTAGTLIGVFYLLATYPDYVAELREEQEEITHHGQYPLDAAGYKRMVKLDSFIRETLRQMDDFAHPHTNVTKNNVVLSNGTIIRPGEEVYTNFWHLNFDQKVQPDLEDLEKFKAFRFVGREKQSTKCSGDYLPFGLGRHACPGRWFAVEEMKATVSVIIRHYDLSIAKSDDTQNARRDKKEGKGIKFINRKKE